MLMNKLKTTFRPIVGGMVLGLLVLILSTQVSRAKTLSEALTDIQVRASEERLPAPEFQLKDINGNTVSLKDFEGKPLLLYFWATWCTSCKKEMPDFNALYREFKDKGFVFLAISIREDPAWVQKVAKERGYTLPVLVDETGEVTKKYGARGTPSIYLIDREGKIVASVLGMRSWASKEGREVFKLMLQ